MSIMVSIQRSNELGNNLIRVQGKLLQVERAGIAVIDYLNQSPLAKRRTRPSACVLTGSDDARSNSEVRKQR